MKQKSVLLLSALLVLLFAMTANQTSAQIGQFCDVFDICHGEDQVCEDKTNRCVPEIRFNNYACYGSEGQLYQWDGEKYIYLKNCVQGSCSKDSGSSLPEVCASEGTQLVPVSEEGKIRLTEETSIIGERIISQGRPIPVTVGIENAGTQEADIKFEVGIYTIENFNTYLGGGQIFSLINPGAALIPSCVEGEGFVQNFHLEPTLGPGEKKVFLAYPISPTPGSQIGGPLNIAPNWEGTNKDYVIVIGIYPSKGGARDDGCGLNHIDRKTFRVTMREEGTFSRGNLLIGQNCIRAACQVICSTPDQCDNPIDPTTITPILPPVPCGPTGCVPSPIPPQPVVGYKIPRNIEDFETLTASETEKSFCNNDLECDTRSLPKDKTAKCTNNEDTKTIIDQKSSDKAFLTRILAFTKRFVKQSPGLCLIEDKEPETGTKAQITGFFESIGKLLGTAPSDRFNIGLAAFIAIIAVGIITISVINK